MDEKDLLKISLEALQLLQDKTEQLEEHIAYLEDSRGIADEKIEQLEALNDNLLETLKVALKVIAI